MIKHLACIALLFAVFSTTQGFPNPFDRESGRGNNGRSNPFSGNDGPFSGNGGPFSGEGGLFPGNGDQWVNKLCSNSTNTSALLSGIQQVISNLQSNGSFGQILNAHAQEVAYVTKSANTALLSSNCTGFFVGLKAAKKADMAAGQTQFQLMQSAVQAFMQVFKSVLGANNHNHGN